MVIVPPGDDRTDTAPEPEKRGNGEGNVGDIGSESVPTTIVEEGNGHGEQWDDQDNEEE